MKSPWETAVRHRSITRPDDPGVIWSLDARPSPLAAREDERPVVIDESAGLFAAAPGDAPTGGPDAHLAPTHYRDWLRSAL
ncbi:hypothetical protein [Streptomyces sp. DW26H14]|uniref:hypothetical protein n=1 Tax=Streptomyces sp. DW26H14 TaxID=3435395 RepID=UPI00403E1FE6